ncbi:hypothetical protein LCGC14_1843160 [marine sediment metagenome]|uniref:Uncharacterized protein n=1 Tax=marine sediment metagenome TaxID=412755 RepID=A0A0F9H0V3_9ZZZZ
MTDTTNVQLPVIAKGLDDREIRLHLLVLAVNCSVADQALARAKTWSDWVINNK